MQNPYYIPKVEPYQEGILGQEVIIEKSQEIMYRTAEGEDVHILLWERYPDYDLIFGVPSAESPRHEKEVGFFTLRRVGNKEHTGFYFDIKESQAIVLGFQKILEESREHSKHLWQ